MAANDPKTGYQQINHSLLSGAQALGGYAQGIAMGQSPKDAAMTAAKDAAMSKLLGPTAIFGGALIGVLRTMKSIVEQSGLLEKGLQRVANMQQVEGKFTTLLRSAELAKKRMEELYKFAASSPFDVSSVMRANLTLQALTRGAMANAEGMRLVGDVAAATGEEIDTVANQFGKLYSSLRSGRSLDKVLYQLQMTGAVSDELAGKLENLESTGASFTEKWSAVEKAFSHTNGGMKDEMENLGALQTKLENVSAAMERAFGENYVEAQARSIKATIAATENLTPLIRQIGSDFSPFLTFTRSLKDELIVDTLATKGFASALGGLWVAVKAGLGAMTVGTVLTGLGNIIPLAGRMRRFGAQRRAAYAEAGKGEGGEMMTKGGAMFGLAGDAFGAGNLKLAASLAAEAVQLKVLGYLLTLHETGTKAAEKSTGLLAARNYAAAVSMTVLEGGLKKVWAMAKNLGTGLASAFGSIFLRSGWTSVAAWAAGAVIAGYAWYEAVKKINSEYARTIKALDETSSKLRDQAEAATTMDDWNDSVGALTENIGKLKRELGTLNGEIGGATWWDKATDFDIFGSKLSKKKSQRDVMMGHLSAAEAERKGLYGRLSLMSPSSPMREELARQWDLQQNLSNSRAQSAMSNADSAGRVDLIDRRIAELDDLAKRGKGIAVAKANFTQTPSGVAARELSTQIDNLTQGADSQANAVSSRVITQVASVLPGFSGKKSDDYADGRAGLYRLRSELQEATPGVGWTAAVIPAHLELQKRTITKALADIEAGIAARNPTLAKVNQKRKELRELLANQTDSELVAINAQIGALQDLPRPTDAQLAQLKELVTKQVELQKLGDNYANYAQQAEDLRLSRQREVDQRAIDAQTAASEKQELEAAQQGRLTGGLSAKNRRSALELQLSQAMKGGRMGDAAGLRNQLAGLDATDTQFRRDRAIDRYKAGLNSLGQRGMDDALTLRTTTDDYEAHGMTAKDAYRDLTSRWRSEAALQTPRVVADSMQSVGGGGGFAATNPLMSVQKRIEELNRRSADLLAIIARNTKDPGRLN